jgi:ATP-binding cassette subfamily B protein
VLVECAVRAGLKAKVVRLGWRDLGQLKNALPAIVTLKSGARMILTAVQDQGEASHIQLQDPMAEAEALVTLDRAGFENVFAGEVVLARREYETVPEERPFGLGLVFRYALQEKRLLRDVAISALLLTMTALSPVVFWGFISGYVIYYGSVNTFILLCFGMAVVIVFEALYTFLRTYLIYVISARVDTRLSNYMFDKVLKLPIDFFERTQVGIIGRDMSEVFKLQQFLTGSLFGTMLDSMTLLLFLPLMFYFSAELTFVVIGVCALIVLWLTIMLPRSRKLNKEVSVAEGERQALLYQTLTGMRTVKSLSLEGRQRDQMDVRIAKVGKLRIREGYLRAFIVAGVRPLQQIAVIGSYALGVYLVLSKSDPAFEGYLFVFLMLSMRVAGPLMQMAGLINQFDEARTSVEIVSDLVNQPKEEGSKDHGVRLPLKGHVEFINLRFKYQGASNFALDGVTFEVPTGTTLGVVGRSGSGKTTVTRLLQRLHSDYEGLIKIDGVDAREYDITHFRRSLGIVLQENFLFSGTIRENIIAAKPHATFDEVVRAARMAGAEEFIERLPAGYDTYVYEGSPNLSGGQRQRVAIARALIVDPRILILDEATSALDPDSEAIVNDNIRRIAAGRTVISISHRLSSLVRSDAILVLERGQVADIGKHHELLERCEIYSGLWNQQNRHIAAASRPTGGRGGPSFA